MEIEVVYEKGVFKPLRKVNLKEGTRLKLRMGAETVQEILQKLRTLEPLNVKIDDEELEWEFYAK